VVLRRLRQNPLAMTLADVPTATDRETLAAIVGRVSVADLAGRMVSTFRDGIAGYQRLPESVVRGQILEVSRRNVELFFRSVVEGHPPTYEDLAVFRESARERAIEGMPLEDLLHAYRLGGRIGWHALEEAALPEERHALLHGAELLMDYVDRVSSAVSQAYLEENQNVVSEDERRLRNLLDALVDGTTLSAELRGLAERSGFPVRDRYRPFAAAMHGATARRHAGLASELRAQGLLALTEGDRVAGLAPAEDASPRLPSIERTVVAIAPPTERAALAAGLDDVRVLADLGRRLGRTGTLDAEGLLPELLLASAPRAADALVRRVLAPLTAYRSARGAELVATLAAYVDCALDRRAAAARLHVHPNTLDYRLRKIRELSGLDAHSPRDLVLITLALRQRELAA
jgi:hypothetical protein